MTLVCCYAACWGPTKKWGVEDVEQRLYGAPIDAAPLTSMEAEMQRGLEKLFGPSLPREVSTTMPLVVKVHDNGTCRYYFWFFGYVAKLPYEREIAP